MTALEEAQALCREAEALLITAGAGMGVDSGLPDFRGSEGFWKAYPPYRELGFQFMDVACPENFRLNPALGWGFYGHRYNLYRATEPHSGFQRLLDFGNEMPGGSFVFTSNVDGHFQRVGFDENEVLECHGSLLHRQCALNCENHIWSAYDEQILIDETTMQAQDPLPVCPDCKGMARPNVLMFGDWDWNSQRAMEQQTRFRSWLEAIVKLGLRMVILEFGAGTTIPTVRLQSETLAQVVPFASLVRVNPREPQFYAKIERGVSLEMGALEAIDAMLPG